MNEIKEKALAKLLEELNKPHDLSLDRIHNWICDQEDEELFQGILKERYSLKCALKYDCHFESIVVEKNSVMGPNQQSMISIGIVTGIILGRLIADNVYFVNVSTWRKYWKFSYKDRSKKSMKLQAVAKVSDEFDLNVKDDEADAILIGSYFVNHGQEFGNLENHKVS